MAAGSERQRFDFNEWSELAREDPEGFEERRARVLQAQIDAMPDRRRARLVRLQWRVDQVRRLAGSPMAACLEISRMMWDSVLDQQGLIRALQVPAGEGPVAGPLPRAQVLRFPSQGPRA